MAGRILVMRALRVPKVTLGTAAMSSNARSKIGTREVVGFGFNGQPMYQDRPDFPFPAIRWKEPTPDICALREKEKGDWRKLSIEEKKTLYRASFCQTFAEFKAPTGEWKSVIGFTLLLMSGAFWLFYGMKYCFYPPLPESFNEESRRLQLRRIIDLHTNPIDGLASRWDYDADDWKK